MHDDVKKPKLLEMLMRIIMLVILPIVCYIVFRIAINYYQPHTKVINNATAQALGFGVGGTVFHLSCMVAGVFKEGFSAVAKRMADFKINASISFKFAVKCYFEDMKEDGVEFLIEFAVVIACFLVALNGLLTVLPMLK